MDNLYKRACAAYLAEFKKQETISHGLTVYGWYHYISSPRHKTVGVVATAQMLILIKDAGLPVEFDCNPMIDSLITMQNPDGGWSYKTNLRISATEPTALSVLAIMLWCSPLNDSQRKSVDNGVSWLLDNKNQYSLWGPAKRKEKEAYTYFSCSVLKCLSRIVDIGGISRETEIQSAVENGCESILNAFCEDFFQCGWGVTTESKPTIFHTAYTIDALITISDRFKKAHQVLNGDAFLRQYYDAKSKKDDISQLRIGNSEIYEYRGSRLSYMHSVDVYVLFALIRLQPASASVFREKYTTFVKCAERSDWRYGDFVTVWRLYDIVSFCSFFEMMYKEEGHNTMRRFKIALTFAGETRTLVEAIAEILAAKYGKEYILYDKYYEAEFARPQLDVYLQDLYHNHSELIVVFICPEYATKPWCGVEYRAIRDILNHMDFSKIMYIKATSDDISHVSLPGFYPSEDGYIDACKHTPQEVANLIIQRYEKQNTT